MKKIILMLIVFAFAGAVVAQNKGDAKPMAKPVSAKEKPVQKEAGIKEEGIQSDKPQPAGKKEKHDKFECPKCHMHADKPGKCTMCKVDMIEAKAEMKKEKAEKKEEKHDHKGHDHGHGHDKKAE